MMSSILSDNTPQRRRFNPAKRADMLEYKYFIQNNTWKTSCPFELEYPWVNVPLMINDKIIRHVIGKMKCA